MINLDSTIDVELVVSKELFEQSKSLETALKDYQTLLDENKLVDTILENVSSIYDLLEKLYKEQKIDYQEYHQRTESLINIIQLAEDVNTQTQKTEMNK